MTNVALIHFDFDESPSTPKNTNWQLAFPPKIPNWQLGTLHRNSELATHISAKIANWQPSTAGHCVTFAPPPMGSFGPEYPSGGEVRLYVESRHRPGLKVPLSVRGVEIVENPHPPNGGLIGGGGTDVLQSAPKRGKKRIQRKSIF